MKRLRMLVALFVDDVALAAAAASMPVVVLLAGRAGLAALPCAVLLVAGLGAALGFSVVRAARKSNRPGKMS